MSRPHTTPTARAGPPAAKKGLTGSAGNDERSSQQVVWDTDAPLPSTQTLSGREQFLQTPAYVIAAHYTREPPLSALTRSQELHEQVRAAQRRTHNVLGDKRALEAELVQKRSELSYAKDECEGLRSKCELLSSQLLSAKRGAREMREARDMLAEQLQAFKLSSSGTKLKELQVHVVEANSEIERLRDIIARKGYS